MSHFTVLVIHREDEKLDDIMAPYQENNMGDCPKKYLEFVDMEAEMEEEYEDKQVEVVRLSNGEIKFTWDFNKENFVTGKKENPIPSDAKVENEYLNKIYPTFEIFAKKWHGYNNGRDKTKGRYGYWANPNAKWDWYTVGGRWNGFYILKTGRKSDSCRKGDIDFDKMRLDSFEKASKTYDEFEAKSEKDKKVDSFVFGILKDDGSYESREEYLKRCGLPITFAVIKDGKWYERGKMGWWAIVSGEKNPEEWNEQYNKIVSECSDDMMFTIVDCHI